MCINIRKLYNISKPIKCPFCSHQNKNVLKYVDPFDLRIDYGLITVQVNCDGVGCGKYYDVEIKCPTIVVNVKMQV